MNKNVREHHVINDDEIAAKFEALKTASATSEALLKEYKVLSYLVVTGARACEAAHRFGINVRAVQEIVRKHFGKSVLVHDFRAGHVYRWQKLNVERSIIEDQLHQKHALTRLGKKI